MPSGSLPSFPFAARRELIERATPLYQEASLAQKGLLLDQVVAMTGSAHKDAIRLLHQAPQGKRTILHPRLPRSGSEVRHALVLEWEAQEPPIVALARRLFSSAARRRESLFLPIHVRASFS